MNVSLSTTSDLVTTTSPAARWGRRAALAALAALVLVALTNLLGVQTAEVSAQGNGYDLTLRYPSHARAGLDTRWQVRVEHPDGFGKEVILVVSGDYFDIFESQGMWPEPTSATRDGDLVRLTFDPPPGSVFVVDYDAYIQPSSQRGRQAHVGVVAQGVEQVGLDFTTRLVP